MMKCPYCKHPAGLLRIAKVTNWTPYRCGFCHRRSQMPRWQGALLGGLSGGIGGAFGGIIIRHYGYLGWIGFLSLYAVAVFLVAWLLCTLYPIEDKDLE